MTTDKHSGGDYRPDQVSKPERKPFPGQPENRPRVPRPEGTKTPEQMRAGRAQYKTTKRVPGGQGRGEDNSSASRQGRRLR